MLAQLKQDEAICLVVSKSLPTQQRYDNILNRMQENNKQTYKNSLIYLGIFKAQSITLAVCLVGWPQWACQSSLLG